MSLKNNYSEKPWLQNKKWTDGKIKDGNKTQFFFFLAFSIFWNAIAWTVTLAAYADGKLQLGPILLILLFPFVGVVLVGVTIRQGIILNKFGTSIFELAEMPGVLGGTIGGVIFTKVNIKPENGFKLSLKNIHKYTTGSGKNSSTHRDTIWEVSETIQTEAMADNLTRSAIPVFFDIPYDTKPTEKLSNRAEYLWELSVSAATPGVDYSAKFVVPVFQTDKSNPENTSQSLRSEQPSPEITSRDYPGISVSTNYDGAHVYEFEPYRNFKHAIVPLIVGGVFGSIATYVITTGGSGSIIGIFFGVVALILLSMTISMVHSALTVTASEKGLIIEKGSLLGKTIIHLTPSRIKELSAKKAFKSGEREFFNIMVETNEAKPTKIPCSIEGRHAIDTLIAKLESDVRA